MLYRLLMLMLDEIFVKVSLRIGGACEYGMLSTYAFTWGGATDSDRCFLPKSLFNPSLGSESPNVPFPLSISSKMKRSYFNASVCSFDHVYLLLAVDEQVS